MVREAFRLFFLPTRALRMSLRPAVCPLRADLWHQSSAREMDENNGLFSVPAKFKGRGVS